MKNKKIIVSLLLISGLATGVWFWMTNAITGHCHSLEKLDTNIDGTQYKVINSDFRIPNVDFILYMITVHIISLKYIIMSNLKGRVFQVGITNTEC